MRRRISESSAIEVFEEKELVQCLLVADVKGLHALHAYQSQCPRSTPNQSGAVPLPNTASDVPRDSVLELFVDPTGIFA